MVKRIIVAFIVALWIAAAALNVASGSSRTSITQVHSMTDGAPLVPTPHGTSAAPAPAVTFTATLLSTPPGLAVGAADQQADPRSLYVLGGLAVTGVMVTLGVAWYHSHKSPEKIGS